MKAEEIKKPQTSSASAQKNKKRLLKNTIMLYILVFSGYFFSLITAPYQTRILGAELYAKIGWAMATMAYFSVFIEFGFLLSATASITRNRDNKTYVEKIVGAVTIYSIAVSKICRLSPLRLWLCAHFSPLEFSYLCTAQAIIGWFLLLILAETCLQFFTYTGT